MKKRKNKQGKYNPRDKRVGGRNGKTAEEARLRDSDELTVKGSNDPAWWISDDQTLKDVARLPFATQIGVEYEWAHQAPGPTSKWADGSFFTMRWIPTYGPDEGRTSPLNMAMQKFYTTIRKEVAGTLAYEPNDLGLYMIAYDSVIMLLSYVRRLIASMNLFSYTNLSMPQLLYSMQGGANFSHDRDNLAAYRARYNMLVRKASVFNFPDSFPIIKRHAWMSSQFYADQATNKAQIYIFQPEAYYYWEDSDGVVYAKVNFMDTNTIGGYLDIIESCLTALSNSTDVSNINMSILKAFGPERMYKLSLLSDDEVPAIVYDREVLMEIENLRSAGSIRQHLRDGSFSVYQESGYLKNRNFYSAPGTSDGDAVVYFKPFINVRWDNPTAADVMVATSLQPTFYRTNDYIMVYPRAELITSCHVSYSTFTQDISQYDSRTSVPARVSSFDWHPIMFGYFKNATSGVYTGYVGGDIDNFCWANVEDIKNIHRYALLNAFNL